VAVILDENTSGDGRRYEAAKGYFRGVRDAGGVPFGVPYFPEVVAPVLAEFDAVLSVGGRFAYPDDWYLDGRTSKAPASERFEVERAIVLGCLEAGKPILGICAGMQMMACLKGAKLTPDLKADRPDAVDHDSRETMHAVELAEGSRLREIVGRPALEVNSFHREAIVVAGPGLRAVAHAPDGVIEAIEVPDHPFAIGLQWHQELLTDREHPGNAIFRGLVVAAWLTPTSAPASRSRGRRARARAA
jgi:putative glutamine amidotransferase